MNSMKFNFENRNRNQEKTAEWNRLLSHIDTITDGRNKGVDPGIKETVAAFMANGFETTGSCEGHIDWGRRNPYVDIEVPISEDLKQKFDDLKKMLESKGIQNKQDLEKDEELHTQYRSIQNEAITHAQAKRPDLQHELQSLLRTFYTTHTPISKDYALNVYPWDRTRLAVEPANGDMSCRSRKEREERIQKLEHLSIDERKKILETSQAEMKAFTEFLKERFFRG
jgi:hypothetical protein